MIRNKEWTQVGKYKLTLSAWQLTYIEIWNASKSKVSRAYLFVFDLNFASNLFNWTHWSILNKQRYRVRISGEFNKRISNSSIFVKGMCKTPVTMQPNECIFQWVLAFPFFFTREECHRKSWEFLDESRQFGDVLFSVCAILWVNIEQCKHAFSCETTGDSICSKPHPEVIPALTIKIIISLKINIEAGRNNFFSSHFRVCLHALSKQKVFLNKTHQAGWDGA